MYSVQYKIINYVTNRLKQPKTKKKKNQETNVLNFSIVKLSFRDFEIAITKQEKKKGGETSHVTQCIKDLLLLQLWHRL